MPKNIVLCSDGTGNSGSKALGTNVWRVFDAIDLGTPPTDGLPQEAFYDDGVGTQDMKLIRAVSGAIGIGLKRNVCDLYAFLIKRYEPGDRIYLFGFSRGAFTVRVLANLLLYCGIPSRFSTPDCCHERTESEIAAIAKKGVDLYANREFHQPDTGSFTKFRQDYGRRGNATYPNIANEPGWFPIHFIGVWDTVEAYGLPVDELSRSLNWLVPWLVPLRLKELKKDLRENDLHPLIDHAYHALALDDERHSFHPKLWQEADALKFPSEPSDSDESSKTGRNFQFSSKLENAGRQPPQPHQVWFAGMHSNVGGGYGQDHLAHVPLMWMIEQACQHGLRFDQAKLVEYHQAANLNGKMYDSRSGTACYFRYRPRDIGELSAAAGIATPKIHDTVLERIKHRTLGYAPTGVPANYELVPGNVPTREAPANALSRSLQQDIVDDLIWTGRVHYLIFLGSTIGLLVTSWVISDDQVDAERWCCLLRFVRDALKPLLELATWVTPSYFKPGLRAFSERPDLVVGFAIWFGVFFWKSQNLVSKIRSESSLGWQIGLGTTPPPAGKKVRKGIAKWFRDSELVNAGAQFFYNWVAPILILAGIAVAIAALLWRWMGPVTDPFGVAPVTENQFAQKEPKCVKGYFQTTSRIHPMPVILTEGGRYRVTIRPNPDIEWKDGSLPATPDGLERSELTAEQTATMKCLEPYRRVGDQDWFHVMASVGPDGHELHPIGEENSFLAKSSGRLYLFVNDARGCYHNNKGEAEVTIEKLDN